MKQTNKKTWLLIAVVVILAAAVVLLKVNGGCASRCEQALLIPHAPDYADTTMWYCVDGDSAGTGADVFYVVSTWEADYDTIVDKPEHEETVTVKDYEFCSICGVKK